MCSKVTSSPQTEHTRWYLMRPPSLSCSWLKRRVFSSVAGKTLIGIETRPNEMAPLHMVLGIGSPSGEVSLAHPRGDPRFYWSRGALDVAHGVPGEVVPDRHYHHCHATQAEAGRPGVHGEVPQAAPRRAAGGGAGGWGRRAG